MGEKDRGATSGGLSLTSGFAAVTRAHHYPGGGHAVAAPLMTAPDYRTVAQQMRPTSGVRLALLARAAEKAA